MTTTATWYHAHGSKISRGDAKTAVGAVSYITAEPMKDEETGRYCTRKHPGDVLAFGMVAPEHAPERFTDLSQLARTWNDAQKSETRKNSRLAEHWNLALSREMTPEQQSSVMKQIAQNITDRYGVMVAWAVHAPTDHGDDRNAHGHLVYNMRQITPEGFGAKARGIVEFKADNHASWMRRTIADELNRELERMKSDERVTHESFETRGVDRHATKHLGDKQNQAELKGEATPIGDENRDIRVRNVETEQRAASKRAQDQRQLETEIRRFLMDHYQEPNAQYDQVRKAEALGREADRREQSLKGQLDRIGKLRDVLSDKAEDNRLHTEQRRLEEHSRLANNDITDPAIRYADALGRKYNGHLTSLGAVAAEELALMRGEQGRLDKAILLAKDDPHKQQVLQLQKQIEAADYMRITSERLAGMSAVITGNNGKDSQAERDRDAGKAYGEIAKELRAERANLIATADREAGQKPAPEEKREAVARPAAESPTQIDAGKAARGREDWAEHIGAALRLSDIQGMQSDAGASFRHDWGKVAAERIAEAKQFGFEITPVEARAADNKEGQGRAVQPTQPPRDNQAGKGWASQPSLNVRVNVGMGKMPDAPPSRPAPVREEPPARPRDDHAAERHRTEREVAYASTKGQQHHAPDAGRIGGRGPVYASLRATAREVADGPSQPRSRGRGR